MTTGSNTPAETLRTQYRVRSVRLVFLQQQNEHNPVCLCWITCFPAGSRSELSFRLCSQTASGYYLNTDTQEKWVRECTNASAVCFLITSKINNVHKCNKNTYRHDYASSHEYFFYKCKTHPWSETLTFHVTDVREVLALDDLLHDVICVYARVVDPGRLILHRILFPPGINRRKYQLHLLWDNISRLHTSVWRLIMPDIYVSELSGQAEVDVPWRSVGG